MSNSKWSSDADFAIMYTSSTGGIEVPFDTTVFGANIVSNTYVNGQGIITFDGPVTKIGNDAFFKSSLASITIPDSVTSIGSSAFDDCSSLTSVYCKPTTPPTGGSYMFNSNASGRKIYVPLNSVDAYKSAEYWNNYKDDIVVYDF